MVPDSGVGGPLAIHDVPLDDVACTLKPSSTSGVDPLLNSSMKSLVYVAPELPPPPYTWLIFSVVGGGGACTVSASDVLPLRDCASLIAIGSDFAPGVVPMATVAWYENTLFPLAVNGCDAEP